MHEEDATHISREDIAELSSISREDIAELSRRLDEWGASLPPQEQSLLQLIISRARLVEPSDVFRLQLGESVERATNEAFKELLRAWNLGSTYWDKIGPIWQKANPIELGHEIEFTTRLVYGKE